MIDSNTYREMTETLSAYLAEKNLRKTKERDTIFYEICNFPGHFDIHTLQQKIKDARFTVCKATLYNTLELLVDAGLIIRHKIDSKSVYELRKKAETHLHLICTRCNSIRKIKSPTSLATSINALSRRFSVEYFSLYVYGLCDKCKNKALKELKKNKLNKT
jgi:Fur family ferric uptake transcriptional regulator